MTHRSSAHLVLFFLLPFHLAVGEEPLWRWLGGFTVTGRTPSLNIRGKSGNIAGRQIRIRVPNGCLSEGWNTFKEKVYRHEIAAEELFEAKDEGGHQIGLGSFWAWNDTEYKYLQVELDSAPNEITLDFEKMPVLRNAACRVTFWVK